MTCIVGYANGKTVWIAGDSLSVDTESMEVGTRIDPKVFQRTQGHTLWALGFSGSYRFGQILLHEVKLPSMSATDKTDLHKFLVTKFVPRLRKAAALGGAASNENGIETGGSILIGLHGMLFVVDTDFQVAVPSECMYALGAGAHFASASLYTSARLGHLRPDTDPIPSITLALECAEHHSGAVRRPWIIVSTPHR